MNKLTCILGLSLLGLAATRLEAQELPRPSMARHETVATLPSDYNMKLGPVLLNVNGSIEGEFNDNIALTNSGDKSDFIVTPQVGINAEWPVTASNTLNLSTSLGYSKYLIHPQYDTGYLLVAPDSVLSFDIYVGDFKINLHDKFSFEQDPASIGSLSDVVNFDRFENIAGIGVTWDLNQVVFTLNYDHINFISTELQGLGGGNFSNPDNLSYSADQISASGLYKVTSTVTVGLEAAASLRHYDHFGIEDTALSVGPFAQVNLTPNLEVSASGGFQTVSTDSGNLSEATVMAPNNVSPVPGVGTDNSYYVNVTLDHRLNRYYTDRFSAGHELEIDVFSQESDVTYATYTSSWKVNPHLNVALSLNFEDVDTPGGSFDGSPIDSGSYDQFGGALQVNFPVTKSISGAFLYQINDKFNTPSDQGYLQNRLALILNYHF